jgi:mRNA interferase RelE/StbE
VNLLYAKAFWKDLEAVSRNPPLKRRLLELIDTLRTTESPEQLQGLRKIEGYESYYRLRVGDYRLGLKVSGSTLEVIRFLHRKEIYRRFP